jgi:hypothetical protein
LHQEDVLQPQGEIGFLVAWAQNQRLLQAVQTSNHALQVSQRYTHFCVFVKTSFKGWEQRGHWAALGFGGLLSEVGLALGVAGLFSSCQVPHTAQTLDPLWVFFTGPLQALQVPASGTPSASLV